MARAAGNSVLLGVSLKLKLPLARRLSLAVVGALILGNLTTKPSTLSPRSSMMSLKIKASGEKSDRRLSSITVVPSANCSFKSVSSILLELIRTNSIELPLGNLLSTSFF